MNKFPSIEQFRHVVRHVRTYHNPLPTIQYVGTVKLHGTNGGVAQKDGEFQFLSRNRILSPGDDNAGFVAHLSGHMDALESIFSKIRTRHDIPDEVEIQIFGEWCGQGIQKGVAVSSLPRMFVIFSARANSEWLDISNIDPTPDARIFNILDFQTFAVEVNFNSPELIQNRFVEITEAVEAECPVGASFGVYGIGEGVVWKPVDTALGSDYWFKVKGEKHSSSKVAKLASVDVEKIACRDELVSSLVTENRLLQGLEVMKSDGIDVEMKNIGTYLRWVFNDIAKEETDTIEASGFQVKELGKPISDIARRYYLKAMEIYA